MSKAKTRTGPALTALLALILSGEIPAYATLTTGFRPIQEPGYHGVRIHPSALAPNRRKWFLPQNLYYEYQWQGWEYSNYAGDRYERYVDTQLEGTRHYDPFGNYITRGWSIYEWTESNPQRLGSGIFKSPKYADWFDRVVVSSSSMGQFHTSLTIGDAIRTTMTPLTFSKPIFNGFQWDFLADKWAVTLLASRLNSPGNTASSQSTRPTLVESSTRLLGTRGVAQLGDFAQVGVTWVNVANSRTDLDIGDNSLKGVLTVPQKTGNVERVTIRISDDSPETPDSGALIFFERVILGGEIHTEIVPIIRGGVQRGGSLEAKGEDVVELIYDIRNDFKPTEEVPTSRDARDLSFELIVANDYNIEITSNMQKDRLGDEIFLPVARANDEIRDGSNQQFIRFDYGLPTAHEVIGIDLEVFSVGGLDVRAEYVVNRRYRRFPNQNFDKLAANKESSEASYLTASYTNYPWFLYGEAFTMDPDYSTTAFIGDVAGVIDYRDEQRHRFEFVTDNDDQDRFPDWFRAGQQGTGIGLEGGSAGVDNAVFPGLDENNDFISDFNQNRNDRPDYAEPFLRYSVDPPEFLFGMDMNNNTLIDRFEDDRAPDYPYERDHRGTNSYGGLSITEDLQATIGYLRENQISSARTSRATYGLLTGAWNYSWLDISYFHHLKFVEDTIPEDRVVWIDPTGNVDFTDPLDNQDTVVNAAFLQGTFTKVRNLNIHGKVKYETYNQRGEQGDLKRDRRFFGLINKADYTIDLGRGVTFWPKWKSAFRNVKPTSRALPTSRDLEETLFFIARKSVLPGMWVDVGAEFSWFENLKKRPETPQSGFVDDFSNRIYTVLLSNVSEYLGYQLTMNAGMQVERLKFKEEEQNRFFTFVRIFASTGGE